MTEPAQITQQRDTLLLSHANPEDNEFTLWLALQLANEGYRVWCDLTKLLGGEVFWDDIEEVIKSRTVKVLYVSFPDIERQGRPAQGVIAHAVDNKHSQIDAAVVSKALESTAIPAATPDVTEGIEGAI
jgi:hypothetical protein